MAEAVSMGVGDKFLRLSLQALVVVLVVPHKSQHILNAGFEDLTIDLQRLQILLLGKISRQEPLALHLFPLTAVGIDIHPQNVLTIGRQDGLTQFVPFFLGSYQGGKLLQPRQVLDKTVGQSTVSVMDEQIAMLVNPTVGLDVALGATVVLIVAGTFAGLFPARKAAQVRPIEALRAE